MNTNFSVNIEGYEDLCNLLEENRKLVEQLDSNMDRISSICLKINGKINQSSVGADNWLTNYASNVIVSFAVSGIFSKVILAWARDSWVRIKELSGSK